MLKYLPLITAILVIGFTALVSVPSSPYLLNGMTQANISDMYPTAITPAGFTFSIWSLIYLSWLIVGAVIAGLPLTRWTREHFPNLAKKLTYRPSEKVIYLLSGSMLLTAIWLVPWSYNWIGTSLVIMLVLLFTLKTLFRETLGAPQIVRHSVQLFVGWINIATVANVTILLVANKFSGWGIANNIWAIVILGVACLVTLRYQWQHGAYPVSIVFIWAMIGILAVHTDATQRVFVMLYIIAVLVSITMTATISRD